MIKLIDVCEVYSGYALKNFNDSHKGFPVIKIGNILTDGTLSLCNCQYTDDAINEKYYSKYDDIYIALSGATTGKIGHLKTLDRYIINQRVGIVRSKNNIIPISYIKYFLLNKTEKILQDASGCAQPNISPKQIAQYDFQMINTDKMREIVSTLDTLQSIITHRKQQLEKLDLLIKAQFVEMFGDTKINSYNFPVHKLCDLCTVGSSKRIYQEEQSNSGVPFLRISNLVELIDNDRFESDLFIPEEKYSELQKNGLVPKENDILVTSRGTLGKCYIIQKNDRFYFQDGMISWLYKLDNNITALYLAQLFATKDIKIQIQNSQSGSTVAYLSIAMLKKLNIVVPPIKLQTQFTAFVAQVDKSKFAVQKALDEAQLLFDSLMQEYFG